MTAIANFVDKQSKLVNNIDIKGGDKMAKQISNATLGRVFRYYRFLCQQRAKGVQRVSSATIAEALGFTASQVRQDFNALDCLGQQGYGYGVHQLIAELSQICGFDRPKATVIVGLGALGRAIASTLNFGDYGFSLAGLFDQRESITGQIVRESPVRHLSDLDEFCRENKISVAIICQTQGAAAIAHQLAMRGVKAIWNLSGSELENINGVRVINSDLNESLLQLSFLME